MKKVGLEAYRQGCAEYVHYPEEFRVFKHAKLLQLLANRLKTTAANCQLQTLTTVTTKAAIMARSTGNRKVYCCQNKKLLCCLLPWIKTELEMMVLTFNAAHKRKGHRFRL